jgi:NTP pyrophosphatase (non-canonical NTP hydrolase)
MKKKEVNSFAAYQEWTEQMWAGNPKKKYNIRDLFVMTAGLGGETGEVLEILKKSERAKKKPDINHLAEELGDVLYYLAMQCNYHKISLVAVAMMNMDKINKRYAHHQFSAKKKNTK